MKGKKLTLSISERRKNIQAVPIVYLKIRSEHGILIALSEFSGLKSIMKALIRE